jgi:uncharacterized protein
MEHALGGRGVRTLLLSTGLGAASSSCSYAAVAIAKSMFQKGASLAAVMAFQFASTNLVFEIGIVLWIFLGWQFTLAEFVGGLILIVLMWIAIRYLFSRRVEEEGTRARDRRGDWAPAPHGRLRGPFLARAADLRLGLV